jgi:hypothetical protein
MPAMEAFGRRWHIGSDDLPLPMISLMTVHTVWHAPPLVAGWRGVRCRAGAPRTLALPSRRAWHARPGGALALTLRVPWRAQVHHRAGGVHRCALEA